VLIAATVIAGLIILVGLVGIVVPVLPGLILVTATVVVWALVVQQGVGWAVLVITLALATAGWLLQYILPARRMQTYGVPNRTLLIGGVAGVVGLFVMPPVGLVAGFVLGVFGAEYARLRDPHRAWPSAVQALKAALISYGVELTTAILIAIAFVIGAAVLISGSNDPAPATSAIAVF